MRLLYYESDEKLKWTKDLEDNHTLPPYAILSHTWRDDQEVTFDDLTNRKGRGKAGFDKIQFCARQAKHDGLHYFWVDTCCIDKSNSIEVQYAINSMFRWYENARQCYVYMSDISLPTQLDDGSLSDSAWMSQFMMSKWFTRGWTLQELLAPRSVKFFSQDGQYLGDKKSLQRQIHQITKIPTLALQGQGSSLQDFSIEDRMSWMNQRQTKYKEDKVYSLLGMFGVYLVPNYGEGEENALKRFWKELKESPAAFVDANAVGNVHWMVPRIVNSLFTGRVELLNKIQSALRPDGNQKVAEQKRLVITGMGGQGKSELCLKVANLMREEFWGVFWVDVSTDSSARNGFMAIAAALDSSAGSLNDSLQILSSTKEPWFLILDNADDLAFDYAAYIPSGTRGALLMTSRNPEFSRYSTSRAIHLESLDIHCCSELLLKAARLPEETWMACEPQAQEIVRLLGSHTLALIQAGAYIAEGYCQLDQYAERYQHQRIRLLKHHPGQEQSRYQDVYATFEASVAVLEHSKGKAGKDALDLLNILSTIHFSIFPLQVFEEAWKGARETPGIERSRTMNSDVLEHRRFPRFLRLFRDLRSQRPRPTLRSKAEVQHDLGPQHVSCLPGFCSAETEIWSDSRLRQASALLVSLSLVTRHHFEGLDGLSMHPLAHAWAKDRLSKEQQKRAWVSTGCVLALLPWHLDIWYMHENELRPHMQAFVTPDVEELFSMGSRTLILPILIRCGWILHRMGEDVTVENILKGIYEDMQIGPSKPSKEHLIIWDLAARTMYKMGRFRQSVALQEYIVKIRNATLDTTHVDQLSSQHELAVAYMGVSETKKAIVLLEHVVKVKVARLEETDYSRLASQHALANAYIDDEQIKKAIRLLEHVVKVTKTTLGERNPERLISQHQLAFAYAADRQTDRAMVLLENVVKIARDTRPETHPDRQTSERLLSKWKNEYGNTRTTSDV